jgi:hypothetical protein
MTIYTRAAHEPEAGRGGTPLPRKTREIESLSEDLSNNY